MSENVRLRRATGNGTFTRERSRRAMRDTTFARECSQGASFRVAVKNAIMYASIYAAMLVNTSVHVTDDNKTLLPWNIFIVLVHHVFYIVLLYCIYNIILTVCCAILIVTVALLKGSGESMVNESNQKLMRFICNT